MIMILLAGLALQLSGAMAVHSHLTDDRLMFWGAMALAVFGGWQIGSVA